MNQAENSVTIADRARIVRILSRVCEASVEVLIRSSSLKAVAIRGRAADIFEKADPPSMRICNVSERGLKILEGSKKLRIELVGMKTQVLFDSKIIGRDHNSIIINFPTELLSIERRQAPRYASSPSYCSYVRLSQWEASPIDMASPPIISPFNNMASWVYIADLSDGGFCAVARFPSVLSSVNRGKILEASEVILPMEQPIITPLEVRWVKRIKDRVNVEGAARYQRLFKFGVQFVDLSSENKLRVKNYIRKLTLADAI